MKACTRCKRILSLDSFHARNGKPGAACQCKGCAKERGFAYRAQNLEKIRAKDRKYIKQNREKIRERDRIYQDSHAEKIRTRRSNYYEANSDKIIANSKRYQLEHKGALVAKRKAESEQMTDSYIKHVLSNRTTLRKSQVPSELIPIKRLQLIIGRRAKEILDEEC
ncbi:hypothetical protein [Pseudomonas sp. FW300-N1A1]|uniref:hypothetical protein n=1 Tax=Pseudomonas sp. FW300-N1A1 TaxID=2075555 RepID=UPI0011AFA0B1|nr:hypothetical protein [Pseudomonas sp. FW300-N1A1]